MFNSEVMLNAEVMQQIEDDINLLFIIEFLVIEQEVNEDINL